MTAAQRQRTIKALEETVRFIEKESRRPAETRPAEIHDLLIKYIAHKVRLEQMLAR